MPADVLSLAPARSPSVVAGRLALLASAVAVAWAAGPHDLSEGSSASYVLAIALAFVAGLGSAWST